MNVFEAIEARRSIRGYLDKAVEEEKLTRILEAGRRAPSARNRQEWKFVVVREKETRQRLMAAASNQAFVGEAPVVIAACAVVTDATMACGQLAYPIDVAIAVDHMTLAAVAEGYAGCWVEGAVRKCEDQLRKALGVPDNLRVWSLTPIGKPAVTPARPAKPRPAEITHYNRY